MRAIAVTPGKSGARLVERPEPKIESDDQVKLKVIRVGICGTDREEAEGGRALLPEGRQDLVIGHEMFGQVVDAGDKTGDVERGQYALFTVRRGCGRCRPCLLMRPDMCRTAGYRERGIWGLDGFQTEYVVDTEAWLVHVPEAIADLGVLAEPMSVVEKAIDEAVRVQMTRMPDGQATPNWLAGRRCLVAGLGPVGLLAAMILRLRGADVYGLDLVAPDSARPQWFEHIGGHYICCGEVKVTDIHKKVGPMDLAVEATGVPTIIFGLIDALAEDGIASITGIPHGDCMTEIPGDMLGRELVLDNRVLLGSVNAARDHFAMGIDDLALAHLRWGDRVSKLITHSDAAEKAADVLASKPADEIKAVVEWA